MLQQKLWARTHSTMAAGLATTLLLVCLSAAYAQYENVQYEYRPNPTFRYAYLRAADREDVPAGGIAAELPYPAVQVEKVGENDATYVAVTLDDMARNGINVTGLADQNAGVPTGVVAGDDGEDGDADSDGEAEGKDGGEGGDARDGGDKDADEKDGEKRGDAEDGGDEDAGEMSRGDDGDRDARDGDRRAEGGDAEKDGGNETEDAWRRWGSGTGPSKTDDAGDDDGDSEDHPKTQGSVSVPL